MAHNAHLHATLEVLLADITKLSPSTNGRKLKQHKDTAIKTFKSSQFSRVNQFEVNNAIEGLIEKFQVLNRDDLSGALRNNVDALKTHADKWTPDVLFLLLALSDQPVKKLPEYFEGTHLPSPDQPQLTWEDLLKDDPLSDEELWQDIAYSPASSDFEDDSLPSLESGHHQRRRSTVTSKVEPHAVSISLFENIDELSISLKSRLKDQAVHPSLSGHDIPLVLTELQAARECLLAVRGLSSISFRKTNGGNIHFNHNCKLEHASMESFAEMMEQCASVAKGINRLRAWVFNDYDEPLYQSFTFSIQKQLNQLDKKFASLDSKLLHSATPTAVSILSILEHVRRESRPVLFLESLLEEVSDLKSPFLHLELLYDSICEQQACGDTQVSQVLLATFTDSLSAFLRPIQLWMTEGNVSPESSSFFIMELPGPVEKSRIWRDQFHFRVTEDGDIVAPNFIHTSAQRILDAGKTVFFLKQLGVAETHDHERMTTPPLQTINNCDAELPLMPFAIMFAQMFDSWIESMHGPAASILADRLFDTYKLKQQLMALQEIYLCVDGSRLQALADPVFDFIEMQDPRWNDKYLLTERVRFVFATCPNINTQLMSVHGTASSLNSLYARFESALSIDYNVPWPVMNVIHEQSLLVYQRVFRLLLRLYRAKYLLRRMIWMRSKPYDKTRTGLKHKLQWAVDIFSSHLFQAVIKPSCVALNLNISKARQMDDMIAIHNTFIDNLLKQCLLSSNLSPIYQAMMAILELVNRLWSYFRPLVVNTSGQSARSGRRRRMNRGHPRPRRRMSQAIEFSASSSDEEDSEHAYEADSEMLHNAPSLPDDRPSTMQEELDKAISLMIVGLRAISRAGGDTTWEMLADKLDWKQTADPQEIL